MFKNLKKKHYNATPYIFITATVFGLIISYVMLAYIYTVEQYGKLAYLVYIIESLYFGYSANIIYTGILIGIDYFEDKSEKRKCLAACLFPCTIWSCLVAGIFWPAYWKQQKRLPSPETIAQPENEEEIE